MTPIESLIETFSNNELQSFSKQHVIDMLTLTLPLEKLHLEMAELRGDIKATIKANTNQ